MHLAGYSLNRHTQHLEGSRLVLVGRTGPVTWPTDHLCCSPACCEAARVVFIPWSLSGEINPTGWDTAGSEDCSHSGSGGVSAI